MKRRVDLQTFEHQHGIESNVNYKNRIKEQLSRAGEINSELFPLNSDFYTDEKSVKLSLMEELCLIALGEERARMSLLNDNIPYVLRGCILLELTLARRIKLNIYNGGNFAEPWKLDVLVSDLTPTGCEFLDETLNNITKHEFSLKKWLDVLTGETWDRKLSPFQIQNLRDRICKALMEKGIVTAQKTTIFLIEATEYPLLNHHLKQSLCFEIIDSAMDSGKCELRSLCRLLSLNGAKVLSQALQVTDAPTSSRVKAFANAALIKYSEMNNLKAKFGHILGEAELYLIAGIFSMYIKINKLF